MPAVGSGHLHNTVLSYFVVDTKDFGTRCGGLYQTFTSTSEREQENKCMFSEKKRKKKKLKQKKVLSQDEY